MFQGRAAKPRAASSVGGRVSEELTLPPTRLEYHARGFAVRPARILEQKRDCSQSNCELKHDKNCTKNRIRNFVLVLAHPYFTGNITIGAECVIFVLLFCFVTYSSS